MAATSAMPTAYANDIVAGARARLPPRAIQAKPGQKEPDAYDKHGPRQAAAGSKHAKAEEDLP